MASKQMTNWVLQQVHAATPKEYHNNANLQRLYHAGFLASYLASILEQDVRLRVQFQRHTEQQRLKQRKR
jgi:hypothetical protein